ncbi:pyridoxal-5'-phosphate-dependent protein subunit beta [Tumebacillus algifaecis]|uniref:Pyridoxal-5'-phosphate-dependent protein subunit beta n=1 Tax=Tumebacillus algifaecis TaxID=1214604 RepID=A0A223D1E4_9BACL|nr:pyridoxal-phosphate dependent enzyme [Tumebacillus algifaecis]ASS75146.1 pyridoxal-5'-phosphate-dependent protein subunit beta [Tumebacillus algifaecis]
MYMRNEAAIALSCLRCGNEYELNDYTTGCPSCLGEGYPVSLEVKYAAVEWSVDATKRGMQRFADKLPYRTFPMLGEGDTPLLPLADLATELGVQELWLKNEGQNPTGSHKDRMSALVVARAKASGYTTVVAASSGNAGASLAAYAAAAGLRCVVVTTVGMNPIWAQAVRATGAELVAAHDAKLRWKYMRRMVEEEGWYPVTNYLDPPTGSNLFGVQGYKTCGHEIAEAFAGNAPTAIVVPTSRGDLLWGIWRGLQEARDAGWIATLPRLYAAEPFGRLSRVLAGADYRGNFPGDHSSTESIGGSTVTFQSLVALKESGGGAVDVCGKDALQAQNKLARRGLYLESSSAIVWAAVQQLKDSGQLGAQDRVVLVGTSNGYKDHYFAQLPAIDVIDAD